MKKISAFPKISAFKDIKQLLDKLPRIVAQEGLLFISQNFRGGHWIDKNVEKWQPRAKTPAKGSQRALLVKTGALKRSINVQINGNIVRFYSNIPYAQIHNEGGEINKKTEVKAHTRRGRKTKKTEVKAHTRNIKITVPKRQFMGRSAFLEQRIIENIENILNKIK